MISVYGFRTELASSTDLISSRLSPSPSFLIDLLSLLSGDHLSSSDLARRSLPKGPLDAHHPRIDRRSESAILLVRIHSEVMKDAREC